MRAAIPLNYREIKRGSLITRIEALNYRCLRYVTRSLSPMHVLVGPNGSGKTTFLDVLAFLGRLVSEGLESAVAERTRNPLDLVWSRKPGVVELALEARIPEPFRQRLKDKQFDTVRYELRIAFAEGSAEPEICEEKAVLKVDRPERTGVQEWFPQVRPAPDSLMARRARGSTRTVFRKAPGGNDSFYSEVLEKSGKGWVPSIRLGKRRSTLGNLLEDETRFPATTWLKSTLKEGVQQITLNSLLIRQASPPGRGRGFKADGSNLPWVARELEKKAPDRFRRWVDHLRTALPDIEGLRVMDREDDRHAYLVVRYRGGLEAPSWMVSDGTLRLLALTILAYLPDASGIYLVEEPENGIHPTAVETVYQSLASVYGGQVMVATHSPVMLALARPEELLCFAKTPGGETDIVRGDEHPVLQRWKGEVSLGDLFASGILG